MLSKCANPNCSHTFRYLHEGKLYLTNSRSRVMGDSPSLNNTKGDDSVTRGIFCFVDEADELSFPESFARVRT